MFSSVTTQLRKTRVWLCTLISVDLEELVRSGVLEDSPTRLGGGRMMRFGGEGPFFIFIFVGGFIFLGGKEK